jgi:hypothetical protein
VADPPDPRDPNIPADPERRDFLTRIGVGACAAACLGSGAVTLDYLTPKVLFEPPTTFKAGTPGDYPEGLHHRRLRRSLRADRGVHPSRVHHPFPLR